MTTEYFADLTDHTIEEAETLLRWAGIKKYDSAPELGGGPWHYNYGDAFRLWMWLFNQTIAAIRDGGGKSNEC